MYAIIRTGGKQYRVAPQDVITVEKLAGEPGDTVVISEVLMVATDKGIETGAPHVEGASVACELVEHTRGPKIIIFKKKRRKHYRRKKGHRQDLTVLRIAEILTGGKKPGKVKSTARAGAAAAAAAATSAAAASGGKPEAEKKAQKEKAQKAPAPKAESAPSADVETRAAEIKDKLKKGEAVALFEAPQGEADDLKRISGVGPVIEKKLHALGIKTFEQVANFTKDDIAIVDAVLSFKGRIERDDWISQARKLAAEKK